MASLPTLLSVMEAKHKDGKERVGLSVMVPPRTQTSGNKDASVQQQRRMAAVCGSASLWSNAGLAWPGLASVGPDPLIRHNQHTQGRGRTPAAAAAAAGHFN